MNVSKQLFNGILFISMALSGLSAYADSPYNEDMMTPSNMNNQPVDSGTSPKHDGMMKKHMQKMMSRMSADEQQTMMSRCMSGMHEDSDTPSTMPESEG